MITEGHLTRHYQGRAGGRSPALIDIAQDHILSLLDAEGFFDVGVVLKGGTAIRKFRAGNAGRFSTDLDFGGADVATAELLLSAVDRAEVGDFTFAIEPIHEHRRARLQIDSPWGQPDVAARLDLSPRSAWLAPEFVSAVPLPIHDRYDFTMPSVPTLQIEELVSEKLARYRRTSLARDLYDLAWLAGRPFDEALTRRLTILKIWCDVNDDGLGNGPFVPDEILKPRSPGDFDQEEIGYLTTPVDMDAWIATVVNRFQFLAELDDFDSQIARCHGGDRWEVEQAISTLQVH